MALLTNLTLGTATPKLLNVNTALTGSSVEMTDGANNGSNVFLDGTNLGIGGAPDELLHFTSSENYAIKFEYTGQETYEISHGVSGLYTNLGAYTLTGWAQAHDFTIFGSQAYNSNSAYANFDGSTGRLGIGTTTPSYPLDIVGAGVQSARIHSTDGDAVLYITAGHNQEESYINLNNSADDSYGKILYSHSTIEADQYMQFMTGDSAGTYAMRLMGDGQVGIGATSPSAKLHIDQENASGAMPVLRLDQGDTDESFIDFIGTSTDNNASSISELNGTFPNHQAVGDGWVRVEVNGSHRWIPTFVTPV